MLINPYFPPPVENLTPNYPLSMWLILQCFWLIWVEQVFWAIISCFCPMWFGRWWCLVWIPPFGTPLGLWVWIRVPWSRSRFVHSQNWALGLQWSTVWDLFHPLVRTKDWSRWSFHLTCCWWFPSDGGSVDSLEGEYSEGNISSTTIRKTNSTTNCIPIHTSTYPSDLLLSSLSTRALWGRSRATTSSQGLSVNWLFSVNFFVRSG